MSKKEETFEKELLKNILKVVYFDFKSKENNDLHYFLTNNDNLINLVQILRKSNPKYKI